MTSATDKNAQSYNQHAREWAKNIQTDVGHKYLEKPAMEKELPVALANKLVLSIGVGSGDELCEILSRNPAKVIGIDVSEQLLKIASEKYPGVEFKKMDMMHLSFPDESFDFVYSSLTFHYANDWDVLLAEVHRVLRKGGVLLFSTHNPKYWSQKPRTGTEYTNRRCVTLTEHTATLPAAGVDITFYNHPNKQSIVDALEYAHFKVESFFSPSVVELTAAQYANLKKDERQSYGRLKEKNLLTPLFLVARAIAS